MLFDTQISKIEKVQFTFNQKEYHFDIKRDDLIDPIVSGNKWRKLKYNVEKAQQLNKIGILTFGGAYSNHIVATAKACNKAGLKCVLFIRGDELNPLSNKTLETCKSLGATFEFVSREDYRSLKSSEISKVKSTYPNFFVVPEGGANYYGVIGCQEIVNEIKSEYDQVYVAAGTGTTAAGLRIGLPQTTNLHIVNALKGDWMKKEVHQHIYWTVQDENLASEFMRNTIFHQDQFGGYAKWNEEIVLLIKAFYQQTKIKLDPIYTAKVLWNIIHPDNYNPKVNVLMMHTGGVQGLGEDFFASF